MEDRVAGGFGYDRLIINPHQGEGLRLNLFTGIATSDNYIFLDDITDFEEFVTSDARDTVTASNDGDRLILRGGQ
ncbi:MAG: hypothetical protein HRU30_13440 [Rhodobacteraceae bacterium]|nr:hypothetical protein [Paracoccaceae bacterium]